MIRRAFLVSMVVGSAIFGAMVVSKVGPAVELHFAPIRGPEQRIEVIERTAARLCWSWTFVKLREVSSDNIDAFLDVAGEAGGVVAPYDMDSGRPWGLAKYAKPPSPDPYTLRQCIALPPYTKPTDTLRVRQIAFYPGKGPWRLSVPFPDVVSPGAPAN